MTPTPVKPWFAAKRFGYGSGLPIAWQGWVTFGVYIAVAVLGPILLPPLIGFVIVVASTAVLVMICARKTAGGWRWRNGGT